MPICLYFKEKMFCFLPGVISGKASWSIKYPHFLKNCCFFEPVKTAGLHCHFRGLLACKQLYFNAFPKHCFWAGEQCLLCNRQKKEKP